MDIFAAGVILFVMYAGMSPFEKAIPANKHYRKIKDGKMNQFWKSKKLMPSDHLNDLFTKMVAHNPDERLKVDQIFSHDWVKGSISQ